MNDPQMPTRPIAKEARERAVDRLCDHFARDHLDDAELERRLDLAYAARSMDELEALEQDLPALVQETAVTGAADAVPAPGPAPLAIDPTKQVADREFMIAVMGGSERKGRWTPPRYMKLFTMMGGASLDFREAVFGAPEIHISMITLMGGVEIIVPPGYRVEWNGMAIMGGFDGGDPGRPPDPGAPVIRISGLAMMGGAEISWRRPGESAREAKKRLRAERKEAKKLLP